MHGGGRPGEPEGEGEPEGKPAGAHQRELPAAVRSADHGEAGKPLGALCVGQGTSRQV